MNNVIFLDFDGVLNAFYYPKQLADHGQVWRDRFGVLFAPECIAQLGRIIEATDAHIIISFSWKIPFEGETDETVFENFLRFQVQDKHNASFFSICLGKELFPIQRKNNQKFRQCLAAE